MFGSVAWLAIGVAAFFLIRSDRQISDRRAAVRAFDLHAREAADAIVDLRVAEQAYVAEGQGVAFWMPKVAATTEAITEAIRSLRQGAGSAAARASLDDTAKAMVEFRAVDKRARDYLNAGQPLMAGDVIFTEGSDTASTAARHVERARLAEHQALDSSEAALRLRQVAVLALAAGLSGGIILLLIPGREIGQIEAPVREMATRSGPERTEELVLTQDPREPTVMRRVSPVLKTAAVLCTDFSRVREISDVEDLLERVADAMDASGVIVWLGSSSGGDLRPVLAHGYPPQTLARMPSVPRSGDNAAAAAYRTGDLQLVSAGPGALTGAIVAPILTGDGCVGALSAEIRNGGESSESVQALASIVAAQLSTIVAATPRAAEQRAAGGMSA
jgi:hypothetical protein